MVELKEWTDERRFDMAPTDNIKIIINNIEQYNQTINIGFEVEVFFRFYKKKQTI